MSSETPHDPPTRDRFLEDLRDHAPSSAVFHLDLIEATRAIGLLQLALRHPGVPPHIAATGRAVALKLIESFATTSVLREGFMTGFDERHDREMPPRPIRPGHARGPG